MLTGDNGFLKRATEPKNQTEQAELKEQKQLDNLADTITEINVGNKVLAKLYDVDNDDIGEVLVLDNHKDFSYNALNCCEAAMERMLKKELILNI